MYDHENSAKMAQIQVYGSVASASHPIGVRDARSTISEEIVQRIATRAQSIEILANRTTSIADRLSDRLPENATKLPESATKPEPNPPSATLMHRLMIIEVVLGQIESRFGAAVERIEAFV